MEWLFKLLLFFGYSNTGSAFLQPLGKKQEEELLTKVQNGDIEARNKLVEHNMRLVSYAVKRYNCTRFSNDDLISAGTIGLIKAVETYKGGKGTRLATYALKCIGNAIVA